MQPGAAEAMSIERRRKLAEALQAQSMQPIESQTAPGGWAVPIHPLQGVAKMAQAYAGALGSRKADEERLQLAQQQEGRRGADMNLLAQALMGRQGQQAGLSEDASGNVTQMPAMPAQTPVQSLSQAIPMMGPQMQPIALQSLMGAQTREDQQEFQRQQRQEGIASRSQESALADQRARERAAEERTFRDQQARSAAADREALVRMQIDARPQQTPRQQQVIQTAEGPMVLGDDGTAKPITGPGGAPVRPSQGRVGPMTATAQKELIETEEGIQGGQAALSLFQQARELNDKAMGFTGAGAVSSVGSFLPEAVRPGMVDATQNLDNILQTAALPQLKAIFGGMPTEGERKILLDVQGSSSKAPSVRKEIFDRAERAINARLKFGSEKVKRLREGTYFSGEGLPSIEHQDPSPPNQDQNDRRANPRKGKTVVVNY